MKTAYIDTSVVLRQVLAEPGHSIDIAKFENLYASILLRTEGLRTLSRLLIEKSLSESNYQTCHQRFLFFLQGINLVSINDLILKNAEQHFPIALGTLDAIHLTTALAVKENENCRSLCMLSYDKQLIKASQVMGLELG